MATITGGYVEGVTWPAWKAQLRGAQQVVTTEQRPCVTVPTMVFGGKEALCFASPHNGPLVVETKIASAIVRRILIDMGRSVDIIIWDCLKKLAHTGGDIVPLVHPILGFGGQEVNPTSMIHLPLRFDDNLNARNLEVDFLVVDVPTAYNGSRHQHPRGLVTSSPRPSPLPEGGLNSTSSGSQPSASAHCGGRPRSSCPPETLGPTSPRPCVNTLMPPSRPPQLPPPWPLKVLPPTGVTGLSYRPLRHLVPPLTFPSTAGTGLPRSTLHRGPYPRSERFDHGHPSLGDLVASEVPKAAKSQDLTKS
ncbi:LOW QUALITY PROTEIN: hypothetical protein Cgig2_028756 [Carnegiea gigantea]|uniref:Uncharacterized protein n=1 Tax=Carnegiea gigantea TaxID=171969 RepID=A0A9Q1JQL2_9CARY|nr:LOW QUALITY PROTEIN: hypothetical protein Cgig2_028756 [Carnegiea gigantea]